MQCSISIVTLGTLVDGAGLFPVTIVEPDLLVRSFAYILNKAFQFAFLGSVLLL